MEKDKVEILEKQICGFKEELLNVKNEKHKVTVNLKAEQKQSVAIKTEFKILEDEIKNTKKLLKKKTEHLDLKITEQESTHIESETLTQVLNEVKSELEDLKTKQKSESSLEIKCNECDINVRNYSELKGHIRQYHSHTRGSQYEKDCDLEDYPCFYCDKLITSPANLETHKTVCCEIGSFACDEWCQECFRGEELGGHVKTNQGTGNIL